MKILVKKIITKRNKILINKNNIKIFNYQKK